jgi:hypothetical protein
MDLNEIFACVDRLQADAKRIAAALHHHAKEAQRGTPVHGRIHRIFNIVSDFHMTLTNAPKPAVPR